jgi:hypothetical protein
MKFCWPTIALLVCSLLLTPATANDDETQPSKADEQAARRLEIMRRAIQDLQIRSTEIESDLTFSTRPLLRYNDESRQTGGGIKGILDATVWRLGEDGRPKAIVALEIQLVENGSPLLINEFVSLTDRQFALTGVRGFRWMPHSTELSMIDFDEAPMPANTPRARLAQMRELSRRFTTQEKYRSEKIGLRLLTQPIDRYEDAAAGILDGAMFVFANGTNPELGLLLECSETQWSYGLFRLTGARLLAQLDGKWVLQLAGIGGLPIDAPYTAMSHTIFLPDGDDGE